MQNALTSESTGKFNTKDVNVYILFEINAENGDIVAHKFWRLIP